LETHQIHCALVRDRGARAPVRTLAPSSSVVYWLELGTLERELGLLETDLADTEGTVEVVVVVAAELVAVLVEVDLR